MLSHRFLTGFANKKRSRPPKRKSTVVFETLESRLAMASVSNADSSVVLIDAALMNDIPRQELAGGRVIAIDSSRDAIDQISTALAGLSQIDVVRVISHGGDGSLSFGDQRIDATALATRADEIAGWGRSLSAGADMLLYGCSIASTDDGSEFVRTLAGLTGADTAASSNPTGFSGDVTLEYQVGTRPRPRPSVTREPASPFARVSSGTPRQSTMYPWCSPADPRIGWLRQGPRTLPNPNCLSCRAAYANPAPRTWTKWSSPRTPRRGHPVTAA
jgi:hypothetical protein